MKRRAFILASITAGTATCIPFLYNSYHRSVWRNQPLIYPSLLSSFCDEESLRNLGISYRKINPAENSEKRLLSFLIPDKVREHSALTDRALESHQLEMKVQEDFMNKKIIVVNGWEISLTEARQCALLSLS